MSDLDDEFSEDEIYLDICNTSIINIEENEEEDIGNNDNDEDLEVRNNESNENQECNDGGEEQNEDDGDEPGDKEDDEQRQNIFWSDLIVPYLNLENYISKGWSRPAQHFMEYHKCKHTKFAFKSPFEHLSVQNLRKFMNISFYSEYTGGEKKSGQFRTH